MLIIWKIKITVWYQLWNRNSIGPSKYSNASRVHCDTYNSTSFSCRKTVILIITVMLYLIIRSCRLYLRITSLCDSVVAITATRTRETTRRDHRRM